MGQPHRKALLREDGTEPLTHEEVGALGPGRKNDLRCRAICHNLYGLYPLQFTGGSSQHFDLLKKLGALSLPPHKALGIDMWL